MGWVVAFPTSRPPHSFPTQSIYSRGVENSLDLDNLKLHSWRRAFESETHFSLFFCFGGPLLFLFSLLSTLETDRDTNLSRDFLFGEGKRTATTAGVFASPTVEEFGRVSGLRANNLKSSLYLAGVNANDRALIEDEFQFASGTFPFRYLG